MLKVIKINKYGFNARRKDINNIVHINNALAVSLNLATINGMPKRKSFRNFIIDKIQIKPNEHSVSNKDIMRLERPWKFQIPVNIVSILETIVKQIVINKNTFFYRAATNDDRTVSAYALFHTIGQIRALIAYIDTHDLHSRPDIAKYQEEIKYVSDRFAEFDKEYPMIFNNLF